MNNNRLFIFVLIAIAIFEFLAANFNLFNSSGLKVVITLLPWLACGMALIYGYKNFNGIKMRIGQFNSWLILFLVLINVINCIRGIFDPDETITTILGNRYEVLALLTPIFMIFGVYQVNLFIMQRFLFRLTLLAVISVIIVSTVNGLPHDRENVSTVFVWLYPAIFLIGSVLYSSRLPKYLIITSSILLISIIGFMVGSRATILRMVLLWIGKDIAVWQTKTRKRLLIGIFMTAMIFPIFMIPLGYDSEESIFQSGSEFFQEVSGTNDSSESALAKADTRTFLYMELFDDLDLNQDWLFGKGASGRYFSPYFHFNDGDDDTRLTIEVGILAYLLKGGLLACIINVVIFYRAIYQALFDSNSTYLVWIGFMLLVHYIILFVENLVGFDIYNIITWYFVGMCMSKEVRLLNNNQISSIIK